MLVNHFTRLIYNNPQLIHNLKKFCVFFESKYTLFVQKDFSLNILPVYKDYRMKFPT
jgi:hypothetical protein